MLDQFQELSQCLIEGTQNCIYCMREIMCHSYTTIIVAQLFQKWIRCELRDELHLFIHLAIKMAQLSELKSNNLIFIKTFYDCALWLLDIDCLAASRWDEYEHKDFSQIRIKR